MRYFTFIFLSVCLWITAGHVEGYTLPGQSEPIHGGDYSTADEEQEEVEPESSLSSSFSSPFADTEGWDEVQSQIPVGMSQIFVVRPQQFSSSANRFIITMNEEPVAAIATGTYLSRLVAAGSTKLTAKTKPSILNFGLGLAFMGEPKLDWQAEAGEIYFVHVDVGFSGGPKLRLVDPSVGQQLVDEAQEADEPSAE